MEDWLETVISQYGNSPVLLSAVESFNDAVDPEAALDSFYAMVWDITTAQGYGLDIWGRIVVVGRVLQVPAGPSFGFSEASGGQFSEAETASGQTPFYNGTPATNNYALTDAVYRLLILTKALTNISGSSSQAINAALQLLFPGTRAYVSDVGPKQDRLTFEYLLQPWQLAILRQSGAFPKATGVVRTIGQYDLPHVFGFAEAGASAATFGEGTFYPGDVNAS